MQDRCPTVCSVLTRRHRTSRLKFAEEHILQTGISGPEFSPLMRASSVCLIMTDVFMYGDIKENTTLAATSFNTIVTGRPSDSEGWHLTGKGAGTWSSLGGSITGQRYLNELLQPVVHPFAGAFGDNFVFMHCNTDAHVPHCYGLPGRGGNRMHGLARTLTRPQFDRACMRMLGRGIQKCQSAIT